MSTGNDSDRNREDILSISQKTIKNDILHFKDDILKDLKTIQKNISEKFDMSNSLIKEKLEAYDRKMELYNEKIIKVTNLVISDKDLKEKIDKLVQNKLELKDQILTNEIKFSNLEKQFQERVGKIEYILTDSVVYPSIIGPKSKYKTFHELIDYVLFQLNQNIVYREKNALDVTSYKAKLENISQSLKIQLDTIINNTNQFTTKSVNELEERVKGMLSLFDDRLKDVRVENLNYIKNLEQFYKDLKEDFKRLVNMKNNLYNKFNAEVFNMKRDNIQVVKLFGNYKREFNLMKDRLTKLSEFIKDVRFRINIGQEIKRMEFYNMANQIDFTKKQNLDNNISSGVKRYINGEINADQLASQNKRLTRANIGNFGNYSNLGNKFNLEEDLNNEDSLNGINEYLMKNKNYYDLENNNNPQKPMNVMSLNQEQSPGLRRRKSVNMMNSLSLNNIKSIQQMNNPINQNLFYKTSNEPTNNTDNFMRFSGRFDRRNVQSSESNGRKRFKSVINDNIKEFVNSQQSNNLMGLASENSKNNDLNIKNNINNKQDYNGNVIKEEEESNSKISENESNIFEEKKTNNNNKNKIDSNKIENQNSNDKIQDKLSQIKSQQDLLNENNNSKSRNNPLNENIIKSDKINIKENKIKLSKVTLNENPIKLNKKDINDNSNSINENNKINNLYNNYEKNKFLSHNNNININTLKDLNRIKDFKLSDSFLSSHKTINNNNIKIDCNPNKTTSNGPLIIEKQTNNNINNYKEKQKNSSINNDKNKENINIKIIKEYPPYVPYKNENITDRDRNNQISDYSQTKTLNISNDDKVKLYRTGYILSSKKKDKNIDINNKMEAYKAFKGKKYETFDKSLTSKIKENIIYYDSHSKSAFNNKNKKKKIKNRNYNSNNGIMFEPGEGSIKHYRNISMDDKYADAKNLAKMVNNLQSYISSYTNGLEDNINMYKNKQNFVFKENNNNSYYGPKFNNIQMNNSAQKNKENILQLKLK